MALLEFVISVYLAVLIAEVAVTEQEAQMFLLMEVPSIDYLTQVQQIVLMVVCLRQQVAVLLYTVMESQLLGLEIPPVVKLAGKAAVISVGVQMFLQEDDEMDFSKYITGSPFADSSRDVASLGDIQFQVTNTKNIFTFDGYSRSSSTRISKHEVIGGKPVLEFMGADLQEISFEIKINAFWGHNPKKEINRLIKYCENGEVLTFCLAGEPVGDNKWLLTKVSESAEHFDIDGNIIYSKAQITLQEYVEVFKQ